MTALQGFRLSPQQRRRWRLGDGVQRGAVSARIGIAGALDEARLRSALDRLVARCEVLRTRFERTAGMSFPLQTIAAEAAVEWYDEGTADLAALPFDPEAAPVLRARLEGDGDARRLHLSLPGLVADGATLGLLLRELAAAYGGDEGGEILPYLQYAEWKNEMLDQVAAGEPGEPPPGPGEVPLPFADPASGSGPVAFRRQPWLGAQRAAGGMAALAARLEVRPAAVLVAAWQVLLARLTGDAVPAVGVLTDERRFEELASVLGPMERWLPAASVYRGDAGFEELVRDAGETLESAAATAAPDLVPRAGSGGGAFPFAVGFEWRDAPAAQRAGGVELRLEDRFAPLEPAALTLVWDAGETVAAELVHDPALYPPAAARRLPAYLDRLLETLLGDPVAPVGRLPLLPEEERRRMLSLGVGEGPSEAPEPLPARLRRRAAEQGGEVVLEWEEDTWSWRRLDAAASWVARRLTTAGVRRGDRVVVCAGRTPELVAALWGVWKTGASYVPLDPTDPVERLAWIVDDAAAAVLVTVRELAAEVPDGGPPVVLLDELEPADAGDGVAAVEPAAEEAAYVVYTSGSTGRPKGVVVSHGALASYVGWAAEAYAASEGTALHSSPAYDMAVTSLWAPLVAGGRLRLLAAEPGVEALAGLLNRGREWGFVKLTPSHLEVLSGLLTPQAAERVGRLVVGGEELLGERLALWRREAGGVEVVNEYGPTEATVGCAVWRAPASEVADGGVAIGGPAAGGAGPGGALPGGRLYVLDERGDPAPAGVAGELHVGGPGLARGYLGRPRRTAAVFVPDPFAATPGERLYRTGDLARWSADGRLWFVGRIDDQIKVRGYRVEPGEVEASLAACTGVREATVALRRVATGQRDLVAYVVAERGAELDLQRVRSELRRRLPEPMVPTTFVPLERLPLTRGGKVDRRALPDPGEHRPTATAEYVAPRTPTEEELVQLWRELLRLERVGVEDDFFDLGGHSLLATQLLAGVRSRFGVELRLEAFFRSPTVANLARSVDEAVLAASGDDLEEVLAELETMDEEQARELLSTGDDAASGGEGV